MRVQPSRRLRVLRGAYGLALCLSFGSVSPLRAEQASDLSPLVKSSIDAVVLVVVSDASGKPILEGSGFLVSADGRIVTNHHVIAGAASATVKLNNGAFFPVEGVLADDADHDLAVVKVAGKNLPYLNLEDSDTVAAGQHVLAIGSPLGLENSVSDGIVSGFRKDAKGTNWIQTTAPASHGNSGGPLLLMDGKVIGVVAWKEGAGENLNFAVPSKLIGPLLLNSSIQALGTVKVSSPAALGNGETIWTSMTSGRDYKVRIDGDYIYVEWVNLPPALQGTMAFVRSELKKDGDKWVGKSRSNLPYTFKSSYMDFWKTGQQMGTENVNWCTLEGDFEIDKMSDARIEGRTYGSKSLDVKKCKQHGKPEWQSFVWILK